MDENKIHARYLLIIKDVNQASNSYLIMLEQESHILGSYHKDFPLDLFQNSIKSCIKDITGRSNYIISRALQTFSNIQYKYIHSNLGVLKRCSKYTIILGIILPCNLHR